MWKHNSLLYINELYMDLDGRHRDLCLLMVVTGQISIIQVESSLIFHSGIFAGKKPRVTYQTDLLCVRVSIHKASHIPGLVLRDVTFP